MTPYEVLQRWHDASRALLPDDAAVWDAHTHTGQNDPDGVSNTAEELLNRLDAAGHAGAVVMSNADPAGYEAANERILTEAKASAGRLVPYVRLDPRRADAAAAAARWLDAGFRGVKLHPRAEQFSLADPSVAAICQHAAQRRVPVLFHSGRGIPSLADGVTGLLADIPGLDLVLAHCGISDLTRLGPIAADLPGLHFDTSWWDVTDHLALAAWVPHAQILYASDTPYGLPMIGATLTARVAAAAGYDDAQLRNVFGGTLLRLLSRPDGGPGSEHLGKAVGDGFIQADAGLLRVHASLNVALGAAFAMVDAAEATSLARFGCDVAPGVADEHVYRAIAATLDAIDPDDRRVQLGLLIVAAAAALTPQVPVPDLT